MVALPRLWTETITRSWSSNHVTAPMCRRTIIASYWLVVFLALPLWWYTTSIVRLALPAARVTFHAQNSLRLPVRLHFENSPVDLQPLLNTKGLHVNLDTGISDATYTVRDHPQASISGRILRCPPSDAADILASLLAPSSSSPDSEQRVVQYSPRYRLAFSLLNEDAAAGDPVLGWEITNAIQRTFIFLPWIVLYLSLHQGTCRPSSTNSHLCTTLQSKAKSSSTHRWLSSPVNHRTGLLVSLKNSSPFL